MFQANLTDAVVQIGLTDINSRKPSSQRSVSTFVSNQETGSCLQQCQLSTGFVSTSQSLTAPCKPADGAFTASKRIESSVNIFRIFLSAAASL